MISNEEIESFLHGNDPEEFIVAIEYDYRENCIYKIKEIPGKGKEIRKDTASGRQMNRLLQGDVGSGKTMVALLSMLIAADNNFQSVLMAPTEILAQQHFNTIKEQLKNIDINIQSQCFSRINCH